MKTNPILSSHPGVDRNDAWALRGIFILSVIVLLPVALCAQLVACPWRSWLPGAEGQKSLVGGVKASVYTFMSYLT